MNCQEAPCGPSCFLSAHLSGLCGTASLPFRMMPCCPLCKRGCACRLTRGGGRSTSSSGLSSLSLCAWQPVLAPPLCPLAAWGWMTALTCCWSPSKFVPSQCWASSLKTMPRRGSPRPEGTLLIHPHACHAPNHYCRFGASCFIPVGIRQLGLNLPRASGACWRSCDCCCLLHHCQMPAGNTAAAALLKPAESFGR